MAGREGIAVSDVHTEGKVLVDGEYWDAFSAVPIAGGSKIRIIEVEHLRLKVEPMEK